MAHNEWPCTLKNMGKLTGIQSNRELALQLQIPFSKLTRILYAQGKKNHIDVYYHEFEIPKKDGSARKICAPADELREVQKKIAAVLYEDDAEYRKKYNIQQNLSHAFTKNRSIITNARIHRNKRYVLNMDLEDFFDQFHFGRVKGFFIKNRAFAMGEEPATMLANLCCYHGKLPQGAPTSPILSNLITGGMDRHLLQLAKKYRMDYTRYADDLTFSTNRKAFGDELSEFLEEAEQIIRKDGFSINKEKTRLQARDYRQEVTGLVVNHKVNVPREYYKKTRSMAHHLYKEGTFSIDGEEGTLNQLEGRFSYINHLNHYNNCRDGEKHGFMDLSTRELDYKRFLFYRYFYMTEKMLIATEGKTDVLYIKAALKKYADRYPKLIQNGENGVSYNIRFLKRTKRFEYFFGVKPDGADTLNNIYQLYKGNKKWKGFYQELNEMGSSCQGKKVILLLDNEQKGDKPLAKFKKGVHIDEAVDDAGYDIVGNLTLLTIKLPEGEKEAEIEDLFTQETLQTVIEGRTFKRKIKKGEEGVYGKDVFSKYVYNHYEEIDFSGFVPLLDALNTLVTK